MIVWIRYKTGSDPVAAVWVQIMCKGMMVESMLGQIICGPKAKDVRHTPGAKILVITGCLGGGLVTRLEVAEENNAFKLLCDSANSLFCSLDTSFVPRTRILRSSRIHSGSISVRPDPVKAPQTTLLILFSKFCPPSSRRF